MRSRGTPIGLQLARTSKSVGRAFNDALGEAGGSLPVWLILTTLRGDAHASQHELARAIGIEGPTLTRHLDRMEADRLIRRRPHPSDRRKIQVEATAAGRQLVRRLRRVAEETERATLAGIPARDLAALRRVLSRIESNIEGADAVAG
jgi:MarR family transcriptional regulator for hemolysin